MRGFRPLSRIAHPALVNSYFLGAPSAKALAPVASGTAIQPVLSRPNPVAGMASFTTSDHWKVERAVIIAMLAVIPGSFIYDSAMMNYLLAGTIAIHSHWGMDAVLIDYCPRKFLPFANLLRYLMTAIAFGGLCYFSYNDIGLTKAMKALWALH